MNDELVKCTDCGREISPDEAYEYEGELYCNDCAFICYDCDCIELYDDGYYIDSSGVRVCHNCFEENYGYCDNCGYTYILEDMRSHDGSCYCESCYDEIREDEEAGIFDYHSDEGRGNDSEGYRYRIGFEIEKEDESVKNGLDCYDLLNSTGWAVERDCSLDDYSGFECISPILPLKISSLKDKFKDDDINKIINAGGSKRCGGHITISDRTRTIGQIMDSIQGYLPLLYALYPDRATNQYCGKKRKDEYKKYTHDAINLRGDYTDMGGGIEFRIFPRVTGTENLLDRARLLKYMLQHECKSVSNLLSKICTDRKLSGIVLRLAKAEKLEYGAFFENIIDEGRIDEDTQTESNYKVLDNLKRRVK